jgi:hypothetical protein
LKKAFSKEEIKMSMKHMKKCSASLAIKKMQIKTTFRFHLIPIKMAMIRNTTTNVDEDVEKKKSSYTV